MIERVVSFGSKHGFPPNHPSVVCIDVREHMVRNPWSVPALRNLTGMDPVVQQWIEIDSRMPQKIATFVRMAQGIMNKSEVWLYCTGGRHRSVYVAEKVAEALGVRAEHRDLGRE